ncbi:MAG: class I SAM-dependent methyltransferase [Gammaproteobacteria bacterium]|jgi:16S rRNA (guanine1516-N2)-methyltransferase|nr:class I SAM-dependent methyltransferase [Gammaproteobacteria bacterium]
MEAPPAVPASGLLQLACTSDHDLHIGIDARGVEIELVDLRLRFHHSFISGPIAKRARQSNQLLLKACNNKQRNISRVLDLTAGWGVDGYTLARHGQAVTLLEQNELVHAIVAQSLAQLAANPATADIATRMVLEQIDAIDYLQSLGEAEFDCIYLDPMFPGHKSGAKPAKEMQILQALTDNRNIEACFQLALARAGKRVVVKRAAKAAPLGDRKPDLVQRARTIRFDVYLTT